jgi:hypothetical protein
MSDIAQKLLDQLRALPADERQWVVSELDAEDDADDGYDPMADPEFRAELDRRMAAVADGTAVLIDADEAFERLRVAREARLAARTPE